MTRQWGLRAVVLGLTAAVAAGSTADAQNWCTNCTLEETCVIVRAPGYFLCEAGPPCEVTETCPATLALGTTDFSLDGTVAGLAATTESGGMPQWNHPAPSTSRQVSFAPSAHALGVGVENYRETNVDKHLDWPPGQTVGTGRNFQRACSDVIVSRRYSTAMADRIRAETKQIRL